MDDGPARGGIPLIGRLTLRELLGFAGLALAAGASALELAALLGELDKVPAPEAGGAQTLGAVLAFPTLFVFASIILSCCIAFAVLVLRVRHRLQGRAPSPLAPIDPGAAGRLADAMTASLVVQAACIVLPVFTGPMSVGAAAALLFTIVAAGIVFLACLGRLAARLGRNWMLWVGMTVITPFGPFIAYFMMRKLLKEAARRS